MLMDCLVFFFKQKTAYEMRISDWSSDVCSSDLHVAVHLGQVARFVERRLVDGVVVERHPVQHLDPAELELLAPRVDAGRQLHRSEERRVGKEGVRTCCTRWPA